MNRHAFLVAGLAALLFSTTAFAQPANDTCATRTVVAAGSHSFLTASATTDPTDLPACGTAPASDVWFEYTAPANTRVVFDTNGTIFNSLLVAYSGNNCGAIAPNEIACDDNSGAGNDASITLDLLASDVIVIRIMGVNGATGAGTFNVTEMMAPANDDCLGATLLTTPATESFNTFGYLADVNGLGFCNDGLDIWYRVDAPASIGGNPDGVMLIETDATASVTVAVYALTGGGCPLPFPTNTPIACLDDDLIVVPAVASQTYMIRLSHFLANEAVSGTIDVDIVPYAANDECVTAISPALGVAQAFNTATATPSVDTLGCDVFRDVWYEVTATSPGVLTTSFDNFRIDHAVYQAPIPGSCPMTANLLHCSDDDASSVPVQAGESYLIKVGNWNAFQLEAGNATFDILPFAANDECTSATPLTLPATVAIDTTAGSTDVLSPSCTIQNGVWYEVTATSNGDLVVDFDFDATGQHAVYHAPLGPGVCPSPGDLLSCQTNNVVSTTPVLAGQTYMIHVGHFDAFTASIGMMDVSLLGANVNDECDQATVITIPATESYNTAVATNSSFPSPCSDDFGDLWYEVTLPINGTVVVSVSNINTAFSVFHLPGGPGTCKTPLATCLGASGGMCVVSGIAPTDPICHAHTSRQFVGLGGQTYLIEVKNDFGGPSAGILTVDIPGAITNDNCLMGAATLINVPSTTNWSNAGNVTSSISTPHCGMGNATGNYKDLWYRFVAIVDGRVVFEPETGVNSTVAIYDDPTNGTGCPNGTTNLIFCDTGSPDPAIEFDVVAGNSYLIRVASQFAGLAVTTFFDLRYTLSNPQNVFCNTSTPGEVVASYSVPVITSYDGGVDVTVDGVFVANIPQTQLTYTHVLPGGFTGVVEIGFTGISLANGATDEVTCMAAIGGPTNDLCLNAEVIGLGVTPFDNTITTFDSSTRPFTCGSNADHDLWFSFTPANTGLYKASMCQLAVFDTLLEIYDGSLGCPTTADFPIECNDSVLGCLGTSEIRWNATAGTTYFLRVAGDNGATGTGNINLTEDCTEVENLSCTWDCLNDRVLLFWDSATHATFDVTADGMPVATGMAGGSFVINSPTPGVHTYTVVGNCLNTSSVAATCDVTVVELVPGTDVILALEGQRTLAPGNMGMLGDIDSATAIANALLAAGRVPVIVPLADFDQYACLSDLTGPAEAIWVAMGTFPRDYQLTTAEGDLLASLSSSGKPLYLEGGDAWADFGSNASLLDDRDGVDNGITPGANGGDDSFTLMNGQLANALGADFTSHLLVAYTQDDSTVTDSTDQLVVGTDPNVTAEAIWLNAIDGAGESAYVTGIIAENSVDQGRVISCSWEFGGFGGNQNDLMTDYLLAFGTVIGDDFYRRGDANGDGAINIADAVYLLGFLFPIGTPNVLNCQDAADANTDGTINIADAVAVLGALFGSPAQPLAAPYPDCGAAPLIGCDMYTNCP